MHIMIDLETMGTRPNAPIVSIGAVAFDATGVHKKFYRVVDLESAVKAGGVIEPSTVLWWLVQSHDARMALADDIAEPVKDVLDAFALWVAKFDVAGVWGNGATFDNVILTETYHRAYGVTPWRFWQDRCYRTVKNMYPGVEMVRSGTHHNALDDARTQAEHLIAINAAAGGIIL